MANDRRMQWGWRRVTVTEPEVAPEPVACAASATAGTFIGSGARFEGRLQLTGDFRVDSEFRGALTTDGKIVVGPSGSVEGDIQAREVEIHGAVVGDVSARRLMILHPGARLHGNIETACLEIARHAFFNGTTTMTEPQAVARSREEPTTPRAPIEP